VLSVLFLKKKKENFPPCFLFSAGKQQLGEKQVLPFARQLSKQSIVEPIIQDRLDKAVSLIIKFLYGSDSLHL